MGIALAALANARGIPVEVAVSERIPQSKKDILKLLGVELLEAPDDLCPDFPNEGERGLARSMAISPRHEGKYVHLNQYENEYNVRTHYENTGPEIWKQTGGDIDYFFSSFLTCGTITGVGRYLKEQKPSIRVIGVEPEKEVHGLPGMKRITGLRDDLVPIIYDESVVDDVVAVSDEDAYRTGIRLVREAGVFVGPTTGAILHAALGYAKEGKGLAVVISPDDVFKYVENYLKYVE
jgi:cysteine synthase